MQVKQERQVIHMKKRIITISREFGSGGRTIGKQLADKESCVIVGCCADYILKDRDDVINIFIHAPWEDRAKRIVEVYGETGIEPVKRLREKGKKRAINYKYYTEQEWGRAANYHMTLDSSTFGIEGCANLIYNVLQ